MGGNETIRLGEIEIGEASALVGKCLKDAGSSREIGVILIGLRHASGEMVFNPSGKPSWRAWT